MRLPADAVLLIIDAQEAIDVPRRDAGEAPEAGKNTVNAASRTRKDRAPATASRLRMKMMPPASTARRRRAGPLATMPSGSSSAPPTSSGTEASRPTCS